MYCAARAQTFPTTTPARRPVSIGRFTDQNDSWFQSEQGHRIVDNIVSWQNQNGGWWKAYDVSNPRPPKVENRPDSGPRGDDDDVWHKVSTIDNNATYSELRVLARAVRILKDDKFRDAFNRGLKYLFDAQYPNGGWPQRFPLQDNYGRHITFNDGAMLGVMRLMKDVADGDADFKFVEEADRTRAMQAWEKGLDCILNCQVKINGKLTVWCQQHDEVTLAPASARAYELPSLCSSESAGLVMFLMDLDKPDQRIRDAVDGANARFESSKLTGIRLQRVTGPQYEGGRDTIVVEDPNAPALWARFYDLETGKPFFCSRDGIKRATLAEISRERRNGYAWYGSWGNRVLSQYPRWKTRVASN